MYYKKDVSSQVQEHENKDMTNEQSLTLNNDTVTADNKKIEDKNAIKEFKDEVLSQNKSKNTVIKANKSSLEKNQNINQPKNDKNRNAEADEEKFEKNKIKDRDSSQNKSEKNVNKADNLIPETNHDKNRNKDADEEKLKILEDPITNEKGPVSNEKKTLEQIIDELNKLETEDAVIKFMELEYVKEFNNDQQLKQKFNEVKKNIIAKENEKKQKNLYIEDNQMLWCRNWGEEKVLCKLVDKTPIEVEVEGKVIMGKSFDYIWEAKRKFWCHSFGCCDGPQALLVDTFIGIFGGIAVTVMMYLHLGDCCFKYFNTNFYIFLALIIEAVVGVIFFLVFNHAAKYKTFPAPYNNDDGPCFYVCFWNIHNGQYTNIPDFCPIRFAISIFFVMIWPFFYYLI